MINVSGKKLDKNSEFNECVNDSPFVTKICNSLGVPMHLPFCALNNSSARFIEYQQISCLHHPEHATLPKRLACVSMHTVPILGIPEWMVLQRKSHHSCSYKEIL